MVGGHESQQNLDVHPFGYNPLRFTSRCQIPKAPVQTTHFLPEFVCQAGDLAVSRTATSRTPPRGSSCCRSRPSRLAAFAPRSTSPNRGTLKNQDLQWAALVFPPFFWEWVGGMSSEGLGFKGGKPKTTPPPNTNRAFGIALSNSNHRTSHC